MTTLVGNPFICPNCDCQELTYGCSGGNSLKITVDYDDVFLCRLTASGLFPSDTKNTDIEFGGLSFLNGTYIIDSAQSPTLPCRTYSGIYTDDTFHNVYVDCLNNIDGTTFFKQNSVPRSLDYLSSFSRVVGFSDNVFFTGFPFVNTGFSPPSLLNYQVGYSSTVERTLCKNQFTDNRDTDPYTINSSRNMIQTNVVSNFTTIRTDISLTIPGFLNQTPNDTQPVFLDNKRCFLDLKSFSNTLKAGTTTFNLVFPPATISMTVLSDYSYSYTIEVI